jgi:hypothetical protein
MKIIYPSDITIQRLRVFSYGFSKEFVVRNKLNAKSEIDIYSDDSTIYRINKWGALQDSTAMADCIIATFLSHDSTKWGSYHTEFKLNKDTIIKVYFNYL